MKFNANPSSRRRVIPCGQKDSYDQVNSIFFAGFRTSLKTEGQTIICVV